MKTYIKFVESNKAKLVNVDYKIIVTDHKGEPSALITDFKIISSDDNKIKIKGKGYARLLLTELGDKKKGWVAFDDNEADKTIIVWKKQFDNGSKKIKVYNFNKGE